MKYSNRGWSTSVFVLLSAALLIANLPAVAQQTAALRVKIPFEFHVGSTILPPGTYIVQPTGSSGIVRLFDGNGHSAMSITNGVQNPDKRSDELVFNVYGGSTYFLSEVRWNGYSTTRGLVKSTQEIEIARNVTTKPATETVAAAR